MKVIGSDCQSGGRKMPDGRMVNEDGLETFSVDYLGKKYDFVVVMDGATGLGKGYQIVEGYTSAEWYVSFMIKELKDMFENNPSASLMMVVENCIQKAIEEIAAYERDNNITLEEYQKPSAALTLLRTDGEVTDVYLIGDSQGLVALNNGVVSQIDNPNQKALQKLDSAVIKKMVELSKEKDCSVLDTRNCEEIQKMLIDNRSKKNTDVDGSYWVCGTTSGTANHGACITFNNSLVSGFVLATDGFDYSVLELDEKQVWELIIEKGVDFVTTQIRDVQENDPLCDKFPRLKKADDLTVVCLDYR